jgi:hypothetical protein
MHAVRERERATSQRGRVLSSPVVLQVEINGIDYP